jgi:hypothetical protein
MATTYTFKLSSSQDTAPQPTLANGWVQNFYPLQSNAFDKLNVQLDQLGGWLTVANGKEGSTGDFYALTGYFNNFGGWPMSYMVDFDRGVGPSTTEASGNTHYGAPRNSTLVFGNSAGFLKGSYPASFTMSAAQMAAPYSVAITAGTQAYSKSDPRFTIPYGIYNCGLNWTVKSNRAVCPISASYRYSYSNTGILALKGTQTQQLAAYQNVGYCAAVDGKGTVAVFTDASGTITMTTESHGTDAAALAYVAQQYGAALPSGAQGFLRINVTQTYSDRLQITQAYDGVFDWASLAQEYQARVTWASLVVSSPMSTQALYLISASN